MEDKKEVLTNNNVALIIVIIVALVLGFAYFINYYNKHQVVDFNGFTIPKQYYDSLNEKFNGNFVVCTIDGSECIIVRDGVYKGKTSV